MFAYVREDVIDSATELHKKIRRFASKNLWYVLATVALVIFLTGIAPGEEPCVRCPGNRIVASKLVEKPEAPSPDKVMESRVMGVCADNRLIEVVDIDLNGDQDLDLRYFMNDGVVLVAVWFAPGADGKPITFVVRFKDGHYEEVTQDEIGARTPCDFPIDVKDAPLNKA